MLRVVGREAGEPRHHLRQHAEERIIDRGKPFGIPGEVVDGNDPIASWHAVARGLRREGYAVDVAFDGDEALDKIDAFYFSTTTLATVGFGDIVPVSSTARVVVTIQMLANLALIGVALRLLSRVVESRVGSARRPSQGPNPND
mgnify:CR=1 FL=1